MQGLSEENPMVPRRTVLAALAAAAAPSSFAQTQLGPTPPADTGPDEQYIRETSAVGSLSLALSRMAQEKAQTDDLKEFAQLEMAEQEGLADVLRSLQNPGLTNGAVKPPSEAEVEEHLDGRGREELEKMLAKPAGTEFDREYLAAQATGHLELLRIQENYLNSGRSNRDFINVAKLASRMIKEHLQLLADIESEIEFGGETTGAAPERDN
jgi:putative membrane protein